MTRYFLTGGAGFLGINLSRFLLARGHEVVTYDLAPFDYPDAKGRVTAITGDIRDRAALWRAMQGADVVIHTAAALPLYSTQDILTTDITGTRNVLEIALQHGIDRVVHISSTAVYGIPDHHPLYEDDRLIGVGPYGKAKIKAEQLCESAREAGLCVPILRPKSFVGPERLGVFALLYDWAHTGHNFPNIGMGNNRYQLLDVADLCDAVYLVATGEREEVNDTFNIGAAEFTTWKQDVQAVLDEAGHGKKVIPLPIVTPMIWTLRLLEAFNLSPLYKWVYETVSKDSFVSIEKAQRVLGFDPRYSTAEAMVRNYHWYVEHLDQFEGTAGVSHRVPWKQGILGLAKLVF
ncbi:MAG: NAD-dependent epimerase/dehydratase family protein [Chloroflexi bacterium]|nr:NAD-dependent epimerase/dehydratase family protein [Chloroflexota bacterium]